MDWQKLIIPMELSTKGTLLKAKNQVKAFSNQTMKSMMGNGKKIVNMVKVTTH